MPVLAPLPPGVTQQPSTAVGPLFRRPPAAILCVCRCLPGALFLAFPLSGTDRPPPQWCCKVFGPPPLLRLMCDIARASNVHWFVIFGACCRRTLRSSSNPTAFQFLRRKWRHPLFICFWGAGMGVGGFGRTAVGWMHAEGVPALGDGWQESRGRLGGPPGRPSGWSGGTTGQSVW